MHFIKELTDLVFLEDKPEKSDIIFIPGGSYGAIAQTAARLYHKGLAPLLLPSGKHSKLKGYFDGPNGESTEWNFLQHVLLSEGVPTSAILKEDQATYTYENAIYSRQVTDAFGLDIKRAIICCQAYHARRCRLYYEILYPETQFFICPTVTQDISRENWFLDEGKIDIVLGEIERWGGQFHDILREYGPDYKKVCGASRKHLPEPMDKEEDFL